MEIRLPLVQALPIAPAVAQEMLLQLTAHLIAAAVQPMRQIPVIVRQVILLIAVAAQQTAVALQQTQAVNQVYLETNRKLQ